MGLKAEIGFFLLLGSNLSSGDGHNDRHMRQPDSAVREHHVTEMELGHIQELGSHKITRNKST